MSTMVPTIVGKVVLRIPEHSGRENTEQKQKEGEAKVRVLAAHTSDVDPG